jgi:hypothetical protein
VGRRVGLWMQVVVRVLVQVMMRVRQTVGK